MTCSSLFHLIRGHRPRGLSFGVLSLLITISTPTTARQQDPVGDLVRSDMSRRGAPGAAVAVIHNGRIVYEAGFGVQSTDTGAAVTPESLFRLGSTTKLVTAATLVRLAVQRGIPLDAPIGDHAPDLPPQLASLTIDQILSHTAGIFDEAPMQGPEDPGALRRQVDSWSSEALFTEPGEIFSYSNPGYWLAGYLIEVLSGSFFNETVQEQILQPVGMAGATFDPGEVAPDLLADAHFTGRHDAPELFDEKFNHAGTWPSGSLFTSVHGFGRLLVAMMNDGVLDGDRVLPQEVPELLLQSHASIPFPEGLTYGYGVFKESWNGTELFWHTGTRRGYGSIFIMIPEFNFAVVVLCNLDTTILQNAAEGIIKEYLGLESPETERGSRVMLGEKEFAPYLGTYRNSENMEIRLFRFKPLPIGRGGQFFFKMRMIRMPVYQTGQYRFSTDYVDFILIPNEQGAFEYLFGEYHALKRQPGRRDRIPH
ncbi:serine hydrolase domain-containing protein [Gemmatimonadota bacterium]